MATTGYSYDSPGTVSAVFFTKKDAENAYRGLLKLGHTEDDISLLMSDETLNKHANPPGEGAVDDSGTTDDTAENQSKTDAKHLIAEAIISFTSMISFPELGISISKRLLGQVPATPVEKNISSIISTKIPEEHCGTYETGIKEGGIIISVDPKNRAERDAVIREFRNSDGHDILGDDGYTEID
ncbi:hypothetical protein [Dyadobacter sp. CY323]|uniref:hypothetical protein n=1 Tax=Dyadobacter sp. CY323 TaxID=2907302 RepID=UPI001F311294|nr:hypothetical protein [Dyadobacter sp. CY323]MCE6992618.1 hypothetical protein [Dyadobacter sp. CY323]